MYMNHNVFSLKLTYLIQQSEVAKALNTNFECH